VIALGSAQTLAWASSYYLPAVLAAPIAGDLGVTVPTVFAAFSASLLVSAALGPHAGQAIDRWGGRVVLIGTNLVFALGLLALGSARGPWSLFVAWAILGIGMGAGLYEAAFAALVRLYGTGSRNVITGITLIAGFASTVGWPLSALLEGRVGWRGACFSWAALHLVLGIPLNAMLPRAVPMAPAPVAATAAPTATSRQIERAGALLALAFAATWFISTAMAAHLPRLLQATGATLATAVAVGALVGPAQVAGRVLEFGLLRRIHPLFSARAAALLHPLGAAVLALVGAPAAAAFALLHGAGNGILTIAKGTVPLVLFGPLGYGRRQGWLMVPARIAQALAPWLFGVLLDRWGADAVWISAGVGLVAFAALWRLRAPVR
jgi:predicted MFS family arabinose efflux permease